MWTSLLYVYWSMYQFYMIAQKDIFFSLQYRKTDANILHKTMLHLLWRDFQRHTGILIIRLSLCYLALHLIITIIIRLSVIESFLLMIEMRKPENHNILPENQNVVIPS